MNGSILVWLRDGDFPKGTQRGSRCLLDGR